MKRISGIYKITNLFNNKVYIGQSVNLLKRKKDHFIYLRNNNHDNQHLQRAYNKYGAKNFKIETVVQCDISKLDEMETYYIKLYNAINSDFGYNSESGGHRNKVLSQTHKRKISQALKGRKVSKLTCQRISKSKQGWKPSEDHLRKFLEGSKKASIGRKHSESAKQKMREYRLNHYVITPETRKKLSESNKGKHLGILNPSSTIDNHIAQQIKAALYLGLQIKEVCDIFNVNKNVVKSIKLCKTWTHILPELNDELINRRDNWRKETKERIKNLFEQGYSQAEISRKLDIQTSKICVLIKEMGLKRSKREQFLIDNAEKIQKGKQMLAEGYSLNSISQELGFTYRTVKKYISDTQ